ALLRRAGAGGEQPPRRYARGPLLAGVRLLRDTDRARSLRRRACLGRGDAAYQRADSLAGHVAAGAGAGVRRVLQARTLARPNQALPVAAGVHAGGGRAPGGSGGREYWRSGAVALGGGYFLE